MKPSRPAAVAALMAVIAALAGATGIANAEAATTPSVDRVLVISLPAVSWADMQSADAPHLKSLLARSAVADLVTRAAGRRNSAASGYATLGAGGRASAVNPLAGQAFEPSEPYGLTSAGEVFRQRTGLTVDSGLVHLGIDELDRENQEGVYDPTLGAFGDALTRAHVSRAVVANADGAQPVVDEGVSEYQRSAVSALMDHDGVVPEGSVGDELLVRDPAAPFGLRFDPDAVYDAFRRAWSPHSVVLVEGSDLLRADLYGAFTTSEQLRTLKTRALRDTDTLVGRMLVDIDFARDAVVVVGPAASRRGSGLTVAAVRAPEVPTGLLRSATSRRTGFVYVADVAPTVLDLFGVDVPDDMEGRVMQVRAQGTSPRERTDFLVSANEDGVFRDARVSGANDALFVLAGILALATGMMLRRGRRGARAVQWGALALLGLLDATYLAGPLHFGEHGNVAAYWAFVIAVGALIGVGCLGIGRRHRAGPLAAGLALIVVLHVADLVTGAHLELNTVFGYSATIGIRVSGQGNLTFAQLTAAVILLAGLLVWRRPGRRTVYLAIGMLAITLLVMAAAPFGGDFGAALAGAPGFALLAWLLLGRRVRVRTALLLGGILVASGLLVGIVDLLRPSSQQTHVGRFFNRVTRDGFSGFFLVIRRKAMENFGSFTSTRLVWLIPIGAALLLFLWWTRAARVGQLVRTTPVIAHTLVAFALTALLGYALNDSGIAIPALMVLVLECAAAFVVAARLDEPSDPPREREPSGEAVYARSADRR
ncbi:MAG: hypothetical protein WD271_04385 [Acidimicrobiia bacterium]